MTSAHVFVEELDRRGHVVQRHAISALPCALGRAYDNQIILDDPFVEPHHAVVREKEGRLEVVELRSGSAHSVDPEKGLECRFGRTRVRLRTPSFKVVDTHLDPLAGTRLGRLAGSRMALLSCSCFGLGVLALDAHLANYEGHLQKTFAVMLVVIGNAILWAGSFDLAGRLRGHEKAFPLHFALVISGYVPFSIGLHVLSYAHCIAPHPVWAIVEIGWMAGIVGVWTTLHTVLTGVPTMRRATFAGLGAFATLLFLVAVIKLVRSTGYEDELEIGATIRPLPDALLVTEPTKSFLRRGDKLRAELEAARDVP